MRPAGAKTWVEISRGALEANAETLRKSAGEAKLMAVVKSNAYGHGLQETMRAIEPRYDWFGVDSFAEAISVRRETARPILILGYTTRDNLGAAVNAGFRLTIYDPRTLDALGKLSGNDRKKVRVHLKIETGTSRQGIAPRDIPAFIRRAKSFPNVMIEGASTHYANIEDVDDHAYAALQLRRFVEGLAVLRELGVRPTEIHTACSAAALLFPETVFTMTRTGIALYGLWPSDGTRRLAEKRGLRLRPALVWKTIVAQVKRIKKGSPVSYGLTERVRRDSTVAVLPVGYYDGYDRALSSKGAVLIRGRRAKILGRVCMNMCVVDVTGIPGVQPETEVHLIGGKGNGAISADELATVLGTINYEVVTRINPLIPRVVVE